MGGVAEEERGLRFAVELWMFDGSGRPVSKSRPRYYQMERWRRVSLME